MSLAFTVPVMSAETDDKDDAAPLTTAGAVPTGSAAPPVSSSALATRLGYADGAKPVIDGCLDSEHGPDAAELMPTSTTSLPTRVTTGPPESPEQIPVVVVWVALKAPGQVTGSESG